MVLWERRKRLVRALSSRKSPKSRGSVSIGGDPNWAGFIACNVQNGFEFLRYRIRRGKRKLYLPQSKIRPWRARSAVPSRKNINTASAEKPSSAESRCQAIPALRAKD